MPDYLQTDLGFSVAELVADANDRTIDVLDLHGTTLPVRLDVSRDEGDATLLDNTIDPEVTEGDGPNQNISRDFEGSCSDELTVPVLATLTAEDRSVNIESEGTLYTADDGSSGTGASLDTTFDASASTFPPGFHDGATTGRLHAQLLSEAAAGPSLVVWVTTEDGAQEAVLTTPGLF